MTLAEIIDELPRLNEQERRVLADYLQELECSSIEETPEMLAAIDEGRESILSGKCATVDEARQLVTQWTTKSSSVKIS